MAYHRNEPSAHTFKELLCPAQVLSKLMSTFNLFDLSLKVQAITFRWVARLLVDWNIRPQKSHNMLGSPFRKQPGKQTNKCHCQLTLAAV